MYTVDESNGVVQILLILSNPSSTTLNVTVFAADESANGKYIRMLHAYMIIITIATLSANIILFLKSLLCESQYVHVQYVCLCIYTPRPLKLLT